jgi:hypothetical protein
VSNAGGTRKASDPASFYDASTQWAALVNDASGTGWLALDFDGNLAAWNGTNGAPPTHIGSIPLNGRSVGNAARCAGGSGFWVHAIAGK